MDLLTYLQAEHSGDFEAIEDMQDDFIITETHHITTRPNISYTKKKQIKKKYKSPNDVVYEATSVVEKSIIQKFKKYINSDKVPKRLESEYIYNFDELCKIIDLLTSLQGKHTVWFKEIPDMDGWEVNFEELL